MGGLEKKLGKESFFLHVHPPPPPHHLWANPAWAAASLQWAACAECSNHSCLQGGSPSPSSPTAPCPGDTASSGGCPRAPGVRPPRALSPAQHVLGQHQGGQKLTAPSVDGWWQALPETALASSLTSGRLPESSVGSAVPTGDLLSATASATLLPRLGAPLFPDVLGPRPERLPAKASGPHVRVGFRGPPGGRAAGGPARSFLPLGPCSGGHSGLRGQVGTLSSSVLRAAATDR